MRKLAITTAVMGAGLIASGLAANAQFFDYSAVFTPSSTSQALGDGSYGYNFINGSNNSGLGSTSIVLGNITTFAPVAGVNTATFTNSPYSVALSLTLATAGGAHTGSTVTQTFTGDLSGSVSANGASFTNVFNSPVTQTYTFAGGSAFTVTLDGFTSPGGPLSNDSGAIGATVVGNGVITLTSTPEPGALALLTGVSVPGLLLGVRRRRVKRSV